MINNQLALEGSGMLKKLLVAALTAFALVGGAHAATGFIDGVLQTDDGSQLNAFDFGTLSGSTPSVLLATTPGAPDSSFLEFVNFFLSDPTTVSLAANTYTTTLNGVNVQEITGLQVELWDNVHPIGLNLLGSFNGDNTTHSFSLGAGQYHLDVSGTLGLLAHAGQYSIAVQIPEPETIALLLAGLMSIGFVARRSARS